MSGFTLRLGSLRPSRWGRGRAALWCALAVGHAVAAPPPAHRFTLLEGDAIVIDGARTFAAAPGLVLKPWAIVETRADSRLVRIEFADGSMADLGPQTRIMLAPRGFPPREKMSPALYLLAGWVKQTSGARVPAAGLVTPGLDLLPFSGVVVVQASASLHRVFVESGRARLVERRRNGGQPTFGSGEMYAAETGAAGSVTPRPSADFVATMPRMFRETIPSQAARYQDGTVEAAALPAPEYAALRDWLVAEPLIRRDFPRRFAMLARQKAFRSGLEANLAQHVEWTPVLYPPPPPPPSAQPQPQPKWQTQPQPPRQP
jgi:hypothetical protein